MHTVDNPNGKIIDGLCYTTRNGFKLGLRYTSPKGNVDGPARTINLRAELVRDARRIANMIRMAVAGENIIRALDHLENCFFIRYPLAA